MKIKKKLVAILLTLIIIQILSFPANAYDPSYMLDTLGEYLPDELIRNLPDSIAENATGLNGEVADADAIMYEISVGKIIALIIKLLLSALTPAISAFAMLVGVLVICSAISVIKSAIPNEGMTAAFEYISSLAVALTVYSIINGLWESVYRLLDSIRVMMISMLPVMGTLYAAGGNLTTAAVNNAGLMTVMTLMENITHYLIYPLMQICFAFAFMSAIITTIDLSGVSEFIRTSFTTILGFLMAILSLIIAYQNKIAVGADGLAARTIKFAASSMIPMVGSAMGEAVRTLGGSLAFIKSAVGVIAIIAIVYMVLPTVISLILYRSAFGFAAVIAKTLGCNKEGTFITSVQGILNFSLAVLCACAMFFIFSLTLFIKSGTAISS